MPKPSAQEKYLPALRGWVQEREKEGDWTRYLRATGLNLSDIQEEAGIPRKHLYKGPMKIMIEEVLSDLEERGIWIEGDHNTVTQPISRLSDDAEISKRDREIRRLQVLLAEKTAEVVSLRNREKNSIEALAPLGGRLFPAKEID